MNAETIKANDKFHLRMIHMTNMYIWEENGNVYDMTSGRSIKPATMKGFVELVAISSKDFARIFISLPDVVEIGSVYVVGDLSKEEVLQSVWSCSSYHS